MLKSTLALKKSDDLFEKSSMSFGEHLDELRQALIKASYWLIAGLVIGIPSATSVVSYFQKPLEAALDKFYRDSSIQTMENDTGTTVDNTLKAWMEKEHKRAELVYIDRAALLAILNGNDSTPVGSAILTPDEAAAKIASSDSRSKNSESTETQPASSNSADSPETKTEASSAETAKEESGDAKSNAANATTVTGASETPEANSKNPELTKSIPIPQDLRPFWTFRPIESQAETFQMQEGMMIWFKAALVVAFIVASPGIFYHIWGFVAAGLYPHERRYVYFFLPTSVALFWTGALFAFFVVFQMVISFLLNFNQMMGVGTTPRLNDYMSFALLLPIGFGISFQLPLVMLIVERLGLVTVQQYLAQWRLAIFVIALSSMILTPGGDITSMIAMTVPLIFLYFLGIALSKYLPRSSMLNGTASDPR